MNDATLQLVKEKQAARVLDVSTAALRRWRREGRGPAWVRVEGCIRYCLDDLHAYVKAGSTGSDRERSSQ